MITPDIEASATVATSSPTPRAEPPWWFRDVILALVIGGILFGAQYFVDALQANREATAAQVAADEADRRENLRFVRDLASTEAQNRPFSGMDLEELNLAGLQLSGADFRMAHLKGSQLTNANLAKADLTGADMELVDLSNADLSGAKAGCVDVDRGDCTTLKTSQLFGTNFAGADLSYVDLEEAWFTADTVLAGTKFVGALLAHAHLADVDLSHADLSEANLTGVCYNEATRWPAGFTPPPNTPAKECN